MIDGHADDITFSLPQLKFIRNKIKKVHVSRFLPLAALIPLIMSVLSGVGTVAGTVASRVQQAQADKETSRHNMALEDQLKTGKVLRL